MMHTGFERDVGGGAARALAGFAQREHFRVRFAGTFMRTATEHALTISDDATDARIRRSCVQATCGEAQRFRHVGVVDGAEDAHVSDKARGAMPITVAQTPRSDTVATSCQPSLR